MSGHGAGESGVTAVPGAATAPRIVVMGVSGSGKSMLGERLAQAFGVEFVEGDALHPPRNIECMAAGIALTDDDRAAWLAALAARLREAHAARRGLVVTCSALKRCYRDTLRNGAPDLVLVHLHGARALLEARMAARSGHYMPASLLQSQLDTLEPPQADEPAVAIDISLEPPRQLELALHGLQGVRAMTSVAGFTQVILYTDVDGRARFREQRIALTQGTPQAMLSPLMASGGCQLRESPVGFRSAFHCTEVPQWVVILGGEMEIGLHDGSTRRFAPGQHFFSADTLPAGVRFDAALHGHWSRQVGPEPLITLFVRGP